MKKLFPLFAMLIGWGWITSACGSSGSLQIAGYVTDHLGNPIVGLDVIGDDYVGDLLVGRPTDADGYYDLDADMDGNYRVTCSCEQLASRGFACPPPVAVTLSGEAVRIDFTVYPAEATLQITNTLLPRGNVGVPFSAQLGVANGVAPFTWQLAAGSGNLPAGLSLSTDGLISGTPSTNVLASVKVQVTDANLASTNKTFFITINPRPTLSQATWRTNRFTMRLTGGQGQNYTVQVSTNLSLPHWTSLFVTNNPSASSYIITDPTATNEQRYYRVLIGP